MINKWTLQLFTMLCMYYIIQDSLMCFKFQTAWGNCRFASLYFTSLGMFCYICYCVKILEEKEIEKEKRDVRVH